MSKDESIKNITKKQAGLQSQIAKFKPLGTILNEQDFAYNPAIGRDDEINKLIYSILSPDTSTILYGEKGIGKSAIIEGLAYKIQTNAVPTDLKNRAIFSINTAQIIANSIHQSQLETNISNLISLKGLLLYKL